MSVNEGTFTMNGGEISGNSVTGGNGGGVYVGNGSFTMTGGQIISNTAKSDGGSGGLGGGVYLDGTRPLYDDSQAATAPATTFSLSGEAIIGGNTVQHGGGIAMCGGVTADMSKGVIGGKVEGGQIIIAGNKAPESNGNDYENYLGGGVYMCGAEVEIGPYGEEVATQFKPKFTMSGGIIGYTTDGSAVSAETTPGNEATLGGVYLTNAEFNLSGGTIGLEETFAQTAGDSSLPYGNQATRDYNAGGGGVYVYDNAVFKMTGGAISYNADSSSASGVCVSNDSNIHPDEFATFDFSGGKIIYQPSAGVFCQYGGLLKMSGEAAFKENGFGINIGGG